MSAKLRHYTGQKNWRNLKTWRKLETLAQFEGILEIEAHVLDLAQFGRDYCTINHCKINEFLPVFLCDRKRRVNAAIKAEHMNISQMLDKCTKKSFKCLTDNKDRTLFKTL